MTSPEPTQFLNVDLELIGSIDLDPLLEHIAPATIKLRDTVEGAQRTIWLELSTEPLDVEDAILRYAKLAESMPVDIRKYWDGCDDRCLNIGIQSGITPHASAFPMSAESVAKAAEIGTRIEITVYAAVTEKPA